MIDLVQAETDIYQLLMSSTQLALVNIVQQRKLQELSEVNVATALTTARDGTHQGAAIIVEMPTASSDNNNVGGPILDWSFGCHVLEVPVLNFSAATPNRPAVGIGISAEMIAQMVMDEVHLYADDGLATFQVDRSAMAPANWTNIAIGYRVNFLLKKAKTQQTPRTGQVKIAVAGTWVTMTCANDPSATIYYTTNGSFPANNTAINSGVITYTAPFQSTAGTKIRARAYIAGKNGSATAQAQL